MSLQFVFGNSGAGKSYALYQQVIRESKEQPEQKFLVLVPEQFTMQTQKELVGLHPDGGILNIDVLSFNRLAYRVFEDHFDTTIPTREVWGLHQVKDVIDYLARKGFTEP